MRRADRLLQLIQILRRHRRPVTGDRIAALPEGLRPFLFDAPLIVPPRPILPAMPGMDEVDAQDARAPGRHPHPSQPASGRCGGMAAMRLRV